MAPGPSTAEIVGVVAHVSGVGAQTPKGRVVWKGENTLWWADIEYSQSAAAPVAQKITINLPRLFPATSTEVSVSRSVLMWTHHGTAMTVRIP